jgi:hypothetical protein
MLEVRENMLRKVPPSDHGFPRSAMRPAY